MPRRSQIYPAPLPDELKAWATPTRYNAYVTHVCDGDAFKCDIYLGINVVLKSHHVRMLGIDAPELNGADKFAGQHARRQLTTLLNEQWVGLHTFNDQPGKYGRLLAVVYVNVDDTLICVNRWACDQGLARPMKVNRYFDATTHTLPLHLKRCPTCTSFEQLTLGQAAPATS